MARLQASLEGLSHWLSSAPASPSAAASLLYVAGDALAHAEHLLRSAGQVRFWQPDTVAAFSALLQLYWELLQQAGRSLAPQPPSAPQPAPPPAKQQEEAAATAGRSAGEPHAAPSGSRGSGSDSPAAAGHPVHAHLQALKAAAASMLLRPDWLDLMADVLQLLHFDERYAAAAAAAGRAHESLASALRLWSFLAQLVKFAAAHSGHGARERAGRARQGW